MTWRKCDPDDPTRFQRCYTSLFVKVNLLLSEIYQRVLVNNSNIMFLIHKQAFKIAVLFVHEYVSLGFWAH